MLAITENCVLLEFYQNTNNLNKNASLSRFARPVLMMARQSEDRMDPGSHRGIVQIRNLNPVHDYVLSNSSARSGDRTKLNFGSGRVGER